MAVPKKFQNSYRQATYEGHTYKIGDLVRSLGSSGYIQKVCSTGAWVLFKGYEAEVDWDHISRHVPKEKRAQPEHVRESAKHSASSRGGVVKSSSEPHCLELLAKERALSASHEARAIELEAEVARLRAQNGLLELECKEERGQAVSVSPGGSLVDTSPIHNYVIAGGSAKAIERALKNKEPLIVIAPRDLSYEDIDFEADVKVIYPVSRSIKWIANDAWARGYRDAEYLIYQVVPFGSTVFTYSIDKNQTIEKIASASKPKSEPVSISVTTDCRVEIVRLSGKDTIRIIFNTPPSAAATAELKKNGFRYYKEKGTGLSYWGSFITTHKLAFAKNFCGQSGEQDAVTEMPTQPEETRSIPNMDNFEYPIITEVTDKADEPSSDEQDSSDEDLDKAESAMNSIESLLREALRK